MAESKLGTAVVPIRADLDELDKDLEKTKKKVEASLGGIKASVFKDTGAKLTAGVTVPLVGAGIAATKFSTDMNAAMANVATMIPGNTERINELKGSVQEMAVAVGKDTGDLADGLYQVVSAFGDTAETTKILDINARAAAAGLATTTDAINLTSAVTKGYGDTSAAAVQKVADLAFQTVNLGQTTFPELAGAIGQVVPMASALGVTMEELFAQEATLTGVTGSASEVSTQLRATFQALLKPTEDMASAMATVAGRLDDQGKLVGGPLVDDWRRIREATEANTKTYGDLAAQLASVDTRTKEGKARAKELTAALDEQDKVLKNLAKGEAEAAAAMGQTLVASVGITDALALLSAEAGGNTNTLSKMFGSVEALNAVLALSGPQAEAFQQKLKAMGGAAGSTTTAFKEQTEGINKNGFALQQAQAKAEVAAQKFGDGLAPALAKAIDAGQPLLNLLVAAADGFSKLDPNMQTAIVTVGGLTAAIGPLLIGLGMMAGSIANIIRLLPVLQSTSVASFGAMGAAASAAAILVGGLVAAYAAAQVVAPLAEQLAYGDDLSGLTYEKWAASQAYTGRPVTRADYDAYRASRGLPATGTNMGSSTPRAYADGGVVPGPIGAPQLAIVHGGEEVIPAGERGRGGGATINLLQGAQITVTGEGDEDRLVAKMQTMLEGFAGKMWGDMGVAYGQGARR